MRLELAGETLELDPSGLLVWPHRALVAVADLHLEKGSAYARRGRFLPPYDTHATLARLEAALDRLRPAVVVSIGDGFHDRRGPERLEPELAERLRRLTTGVDWVWVRGNHDPEPPVGLGGRPLPELRLDGLVLRHEPTGGRVVGEVAGHLHPKARVAARRLGVVRRPCFASDGGRLLLPAFGSFTGGLDVLDPAIAGLFPAGFAAYLLGEERVFRLPHGRLLPDPRSAALAR
jgi:hypothetical protein